MTDNSAVISTGNWNGKGVKPFAELAAALADDPGVLELETGELAQSVLRLFGSRILDRTLPASEPGETIATYVSRVWASLTPTEQAAVETAGIRNMQTLAEFSVVAIQRELWHALTCGTWANNREGLDGYRDWVENTLIAQYGRSASYAWKWAMTMVALHLLYQNRARLALKDALPNEPLTIFQGGTFNRYLRCGAYIVEQFDVIRQAALSLTWQQLEKLRASESLDETASEPRAYLWRAMAAIRKLLGLVNDQSVHQSDIDQAVAKSKPNVAPVQATPTDTGYTANLDPVQMAELRRVGLLRDDCPEQIAAQYRMVMRPMCSKCGQPLWLATDELPAMTSKVLCPGCNCYWQASDESANPRVNWQPVWSYRSATDTGWSDWQAIDQAPDLEHSPLAGAPILDELWGVSIVTWTVKESQTIKEDIPDDNTSIDDERPDNPNVADPKPCPAPSCDSGPISVQPSGGDSADCGAVSGERADSGPDAGRVASEPAPVSPDDRPAVTVEVGKQYLHAETPGLLLKVTEVKPDGKVKAQVLRAGQSRLEVGDKHAYSFRASALLPA